jgi:serine acetyltransferase
MFENVRADFRMARQVNVGRDWGGPLINLRVLLQGGTMATLIYRFSSWVMRLKVPVLRHLLLIPVGVLKIFCQVWTGVHISPHAEIGPGLVVHSTVGVFVPKMKIGKNCVLQTGVLIGARTPPIGDNVYFGPGAKVLAGAKIGNNVVIMANSVVITDVADNTTVIGVPARIKFRGGRPQYFRGAGTAAPSGPKASGEG